MKNFLHLLMLYLGVPLLWIYIKIVAFTSKFVVTGEQTAIDLAAENKGHIFVFWHNRQFMLPFLRRGEPIYCLVSQSKDGEYIKKFINLSGKRVVRGSSSKRGMQATRELLRILKKGHAVGIATDGPRGPAFKVKPGVIHMAKVTKLPIIPVSIAATKKKVLNSWDRTHIYYPFGRVSVAYGEPIYYDPELSTEDACELVRQELEKTAEIAEQKLLV